MPEKNDHEKSKNYNPKLIWGIIVAAIVAIAGGTYYYQSNDQNLTTTPSPQISTTPAQQSATSLTPFDQDAQRGPNANAPGAADKPSNNDMEGSQKMTDDSGNQKPASAKNIGSDAPEKDILPINIAGTKNLPKDVINTIIGKDSKNLIGVLNFEFGADNTPASNIIAFMKDISIKLKGKTKIVIAGHTDSIGSKIFNKKLSERRAMFVVNNMKKLINDKSDEVGVMAYGELFPIEDNLSEAGRAKNRRVAIYAE